MRNHCFVQNTSETWKVIPGVSQKTVMFWWNLSDTRSWPISAPPNGSQNGLCAPYVEAISYLLSCLLKRKLCFCHWLSHMKLISSHFAGTEAAVSKSALSLCFVPVNAGKILNSLCTKLFINLVLFWNFASLGLGCTGHSIWLWKPSTIWAGSVLIFKSFFPYPVAPFWWGSCEFN